MPSRWHISSSSTLRWKRSGPNFVHSPFTCRCFCISVPQRSDITPLRKQLKDANRQARLEAPSQHQKDSIDRTPSPWELTVGIEIHAQLNSIRKLFSRSRAQNDDVPNTSLAPFDVAVPGSQPAFQLSALVPALRAAIALNCDIEPVSQFDRKHYFYHDQPLGYQITQYYRPLARNGSIKLTSQDGLSPIDGEDLVVGIKQVQIEQDTAKTQQLEDGMNLIDFTRCGQPLIEIISLPQIHSPEAAAAYLKKIQAILLSVDSVTTGMEFGGLRADVNVSVRRIDDSPGVHSYSGITGLGQRTEIKNLSSFRAVQDAIKAERDRQIFILRTGGVVKGETRGWSSTTPNETTRLRGKEGEVDYRYMPDPDIAPLIISGDLITYLKENMPPDPEYLVNMLTDHYGLTPVDARDIMVLDHGQRLIYYQEVAEHLPSTSEIDRLAKSKVAANWVLHELGALLSTSDTIWTPETVPAMSMARIIELQCCSKITGPSAKQLLRTVFQGDKDTIDNIVTRENLWFHPLNEAELKALASKVILDNAATATSIRKGNHRKVAFLVGQMMQTGDRNRLDARTAESTLRYLLLG